jgi:VWFA-related protein
MRERRVLIAAVLLTVVATEAGRAHEPSQRPAFRAAVEMLEVDARVFDQDGRFVSDLTAGDFELFEDGQRQQIQTLFLVGGMAGAGAAGEAVRGSRAAREAPRAPHTWIFVLDQRHMALNGFVRARDAITSFLAERFQDGDLAGIVFNDRMIGDRISSTRDEYLAAVGKLVQPHDDIAGGVPGRNPVLRATATLDVLDALAAGLAELAGPKTVVLLSDGFTWKADLMQLAGTLRDVVGRLARAGAKVYAVDTRGIEGAPDHGLNSLAVDTGGLVLFNLNNIGTALDEIAADTNTYYVIGYQPSNTRLDGEYRAIDVRVKRAGVTVRARKGYLALPPSQMRVPKAPESR